MTLNVRRRHKDMLLTPATTHVAAFRVSLRCGKCHVPRAIVVTQGRYGKVWDVDWAAIFERVRFRCRCGSLADALQVERHTHDRPEEVLFVWECRERHG